MTVEPDLRVDTATGHLDEIFWRGLDRHQLLIPRCATCDRWVWPARPVCPSCHTDAPVWTEVEPMGTLYSWTRTWYSFVPERSERLPYTVALVELDEASGVRVLGLFEESEPSIGTPVVGRYAPADTQTFGLPTLRWIEDRRQ